MRTSTTRGLQRSAAVLCVIGLLAACSSEDDGDTQTSEPETTAEEGASDGVLAGVCPETVVIQADWEPESEHGGIYQLLGDTYDIDTDAKSVSGPLMAGDEATGVDVEIRIGGASVGYQTAQSLLYQDTDILLGYGRVTEYMVTQDTTPVVSVLATLEKSPYSIYWDTETYPDATTIEDLKADGVRILMGSEPTVWEEYLLGEGIVDASQVDKSEAPKPATFIAAAGEVAEAGFISAEPYLYEVEVPEWQKPVTAQLIHDTGYPEYFQSLVVRSDDVAAQAECLTALVPILQQAEVDYVTDPARTNGLIAELVETYDTGWVYTVDLADWSIATQLEYELVSNGDDATLGNYDMDRVQTLIDIITEYTDYDVSGFAPEDLVTNEFIDTSIGLP
jgi:hypothetical protein